MQRKFLIAAAAALLGAGVAAPFAIAAANETPIKGSIQLPAEKPDVEENDQAEAQRLAALAKITPAQAIAAARQRAGGVAGQAKLEEEDGFLVYAVHVGDQEVVVDAGNGQVLAMEREEADERDGDEKGDERG
ncbi:MAG: hypothetical protein JWM80_3886 [Cyanobacteria bacterium RYN_339]|nr:hypothetical protein [Cyanobacteria bacterium RYN_339]